MGIGNGQGQGFNFGGGQSASDPMSPQVRPAGYSAPMSTSFPTQQPPSGPVQQAQPYQPSTFPAQPSYQPLGPINPQGRPPGMMVQLPEYFRQNPQMSPGQQHQMMMQTQDKFRGPMAGGLGPYADGIRSRFGWRGWGS